MRPEVLILGEMIAAGEQAQSLVFGVDLQGLEADRLRRDALLWNFTVLGEASTQLDDDFKSKFPEIDWTKPAQLRNRIVHGYWSIDRPRWRSDEMRKRILLGAVGLGAAAVAALKATGGGKASGFPSPGRRGVSAGLWTAIRSRAAHELRTASD